MWLQIKRYMWSTWIKEEKGTVIKIMLTKRIKWDLPCEACVILAKRWLAPWWWFPGKPKHVGAAFLVLICFNKLCMCISWTIKGLIYVLSGLYVFVGFIFISFHIILQALTLTLVCAVDWTLTTWLILSHCCHLVALSLLRFSFAFCGKEAWRHCKPALS